MSRALAIAAVVIVSALSLGIAAAQSVGEPSVGAPPSSATPIDAAALSRIAGPTASRAITFQVGDAFVGPGPITVGWLGAKKQILLPEGRWILLAAGDSLSTHPTRVPTTTMMFAQFQGPALRALLVAYFNSRTAPSGATWAEAMACESTAAADSSASPPKAELVVRGRIRGCVVVEAVTARASPGHWQGEVAARARAVLESLGITIEPYPYVRSDLFFAGDMGNHLKLIRVDVGEGPRTVALRRQAARTWAESAALGYTKSLPQDDIEPIRH